MHHPPEAGRNFEGNNRLRDTFKTTFLCHCYWEGQHPRIYNIYIIIIIYIYILVYLYYIHMFLAVYFRTLGCSPTKKDVKRNDMLSKLDPQTLKMCWMGKLV